MKGMKSESTLSVEFLSYLRKYNRREVPDKMILFSCLENQYRVGVLHARNSNFFRKIVQIECPLLSEFFFTQE